MREGTASVPSPEGVMKARRSTSLGWMISVLLLAVAPGNSVSAQGGTGPTGDLTLPEAVRLALEKHPALRAAGYQAEAAAAGVDQARSGFLPRVDFSEGFTRSDNPVYAFGALLNQGRFTQADFAVDRLNHPDPISNWRTNIGGSVPLFLGGRTVLGYQQAQIGVDLGRGTCAVVAGERFHGNGELFEFGAGGGGAGESLFGFGEQVFGLVEAVVQACDAFVELGSGEVRLRLQGRVV
jgi:hypothetical protein